MFLEFLEAQEGGETGRGFPAAGIPLTSSPDDRAVTGLPLTEPPGCLLLRVVPHCRWSPTGAAAMGNTTSDRVAGERHGAKAARAEGASGHGLDREHKIMVGSTDDPSLFSLPDSKVSVLTPPVSGGSVAPWVTGFLLP